MLQNCEPHLLSCAIEALQIVVFPLLSCKDVDDGISEVEHLPLASAEQCLAVQISPKIRLSHYLLIGQTLHQ